MNLKELYDATPVARHSGIQVDGNLVRVRTAAGELDLYVIQSNDGELWPIPEGREVLALKTALARVQADLTAVKGTVAAIKTKVGA